MVHASPEPMTAGCTSRLSMLDSAGFVGVARSNGIHLVDPVVGRVGNAAKMGGTW